MQDSEDVAKNDSTAEDSDNDGMDVDDDVPKSSKGIQSFDISEWKNCSFMCGKRYHYHIWMWPTQGTGIEGPEIPNC